MSTLHSSHGTILYVEARRTVRVLKDLVARPSCSCRVREGLRGRWTFYL